jgi:hypothetical protein
MPLGKRQLLVYRRGSAPIADPLVRPYLLLFHLLEWPGADGHAVSVDRLESRPHCQHGVDWQDAEMVIRQSRPPFPQQIGEEKLLVMGQGRGGRFLQII